MNIRPFTDALRKEWKPGWYKTSDTQVDKTRIVLVSGLFREKEITKTLLAKQGDRWVEVQLWSDGRHRVSHMVVTADCPCYGDHPSRMKGTTPPTSFQTPEEMVQAIHTELSRTDHP